MRWFSSARVGWAHAVARRTPVRLGLASAVAGLFLGLAAPLSAPLNAQAERPGELLPTAPQASAPSPDSLELVDRVAAIVGDTAILLSEVRQEFVRLQAQGVELPPPGTRERDQLAERILSAMVDRYLILLEAKRAGTTASDEEVEQLTEERFEEVRRNFASQAEFQRAVEESGQNMFQYRQALRAEARAEILLQRFRAQLERGGQLPPVTISDEEIAEYFEEHAARETRPARFTFHRLAVTPQPSESAEDSARARAREALEEIRAGEDFAVVARRYSEDPGSREQGGELGWLRRGDVVPAFGDAAWTAPAGVAVGPVRTRFGYHIIRVDNVRGGERNLRHILVRPQISEEQVREAEALARALADSLRAGADARDLAQRHRDMVDEDVRFEEVDATQLARLGAEYRPRLERTLPGEVLDPFRVAGEGGRPNFVVLEMLGYRPAGPYELDEVRDLIRQRLRTEKQLDRYLEELRQTTYVRILI